MPDKYIETCLGEAPSEHAWLSRKFYVKCVVVHLFSSVRAKRRDLALLRTLDSVREKHLCGPASNGFRPVNCHRGALRDCTGQRCRGVAGPNGREVDDGTSTSQRVVGEDPVVPPCHYRRMGGTNLLTSQSRVALSRISEIGASTKFPWRSPCWRSRSRAARLADTITATRRLEGRR